MHTRCFKVNGGALAMGKKRWTNIAVTLRRSTLLTDVSIAHILFIHPTNSAIYNPPL